MSTYNSIIFARNIARWQVNFINLPKAEMEFINCQYVNSKFLRACSKAAYSGGRFLHCEESYAETTLTEIEDISVYMKSVYLEWKHVFDLIKQNPEMLAEFQEKFKN